MGVGMERKLGRKRMRRLGVFKRISRVGSSEAGGGWGRRRDLHCLSDSRRAARATGKSVSRSKHSRQERGEEREEGGSSLGATRRAARAQERERGRGKRASERAARGVSSAGPRQTVPRPSPWSMIFAASDHRGWKGLLRMNRLWLGVRAARPQLSRPQCFSRRRWRRRRRRARVAQRGIEGGDADGTSVRLSPTTAAGCSSSSSPHSRPGGLGLASFSSSPRF